MANLKIWTVHLKDGRWTVTNLTGDDNRQQRGMTIHEARKLAKQRNAEQQLTDRPHK